MQSQSMTEYGAPLAAREGRTPQPRGAEVLIQVRHCGVCHSDLHIHDGYFELGGGKHLDVRGLRTLPFTLGHEIEGTVFARGPEATGVQIGVRRVVYPWIGCGTCTMCRSGHEIYCNRPRHLGIYTDGGFATHVLVPHERYLLDATGIDPALAGICMCSGLTAFSALNRIAAEAAEGPALIVGLGGVGMMAVELAKTLFRDAPLVADIDAAKRSAALARGAAAAYDPADPGARKALMTDTDGGVAAAADFVGSESSFVFANGALRKGGKLVVAGMMGGSFSMPVPMLPMRAITIAGSFVGTLDEAKALLDLVRAGAVLPIPIEKRPLESANRALDDLRGGRVMGRVVLTP